jgi:hypothetical protein
MLRFQKDLGTGSSFEIALNDLPSNTSEESVARIKNCMFDLIQRFSVMKMDILSIGGGHCLEEREFELYDNSVTIIDIDETGNLSKILPSMKTSRSRYIISDYSQTALKTKFNLVYFSGFTPDEFHRREVLERLSGSTHENITKDTNLLNDWPLSISPFHPLVHKSAKNIKKNGRMIIQSYSNGVDPNQFKTFLNAAQKAFLDMGLIMEEVYSFSESPAVLLYIAKKKNAPKPKGNTLTKFHGRAELSNSCVQIFSIDSQKSTSDYQ